MSKQGNQAAATVDKARLAEAWKQVISADIKLDEEDLISLSKLTFECFKSINDPSFNNREQAEALRKQKNEKQKGKYGVVDIPPGEPIDLYLRNSLKEVWKKSCSMVHKYVSSVLGFDEAGRVKTLNPSDLGVSWERHMNQVLEFFIMIQDTYIKPEDLEFSKTRETFKAAKIQADYLASGDDMKNSIEIMFDRFSKEGRNWNLFVKDRIPEW
jgi:hypothetical protein